MRAATGGPRSHNTPSRSRPQSTTTRLQRGCDTKSLTDLRVSPKMRVHRFAGCPGWNGPRPLPGWRAVDLCGYGPEETGGIPPMATWGRSAPDRRWEGIRVLVTPRQYGRTHGRWTAAGVERGPAAGGHQRGRAAVHPGRCRVGQ